MRLSRQQSIDTLQWFAKYETPEQRAAWEEVHGAFEDFLSYSPTVEEWSMACSRLLLTAQMFGIFYNDLLSKKS